MRLTLAVLFALAATPVLAQFPPPGVYACTDPAGAPVGTLNLFAAGDYAWTAADGTAGTGQVASAGTSVQALSGPLKDLGVSGTYTVDGELGYVFFDFTSSLGPISCGPPPD
jgi:hypothetical protein